MVAENILNLPVTTDRAMRIAKPKIQGQYLQYNNVTK